jgi:hypothetical protein
LKLSVIEPSENAFSFGDSAETRLETHKRAEGLEIVGIERDRAGSSGMGIVDIERDRAGSSGIDDGTSFGDRENFSRIKTTRC